MAHVLLGHPRRAEARVMGASRELLDVGERAPSFSLPDQDGRPVRFDDLLGKGPIVLFFYPKDMSPGCTTEACGFRDANAEFAAAGATVIGISSDPVDSHRRFVDMHRLPYTLLSDAGGRVRAQFGVRRQFLGLVDARITFVLDRDGVVRHRFDSSLLMQRHVAEALETVQRLAVR
jgi:peroxiredoxin Q/BCP